MPHTLLPLIDLDRTSFWLGFLAGSLLVILLARLKPFLASIPPFLKERYTIARQGWLAGMEVRHRNDTLRQAQSLHLAAPLFALDEILIPPVLLAPPASAEPDEPAHDEQLVEQVLPYMPDWPELAAVYHAPSLTLLEALGGGTHLAITGQPGSGKTVALAYLATLFSRRAGLLSQADLGDLSLGVPFLVHASDLELQAEGATGPLAILTGAVAVHSSPLSLPRLPRFVQTIFTSGRAVLLLDGLDELPPSDHHATVQFLAALLNAFPKTRAVVAIDPARTAGLEALGFALLPLAAWNQEQRIAFIRKWGERWAQFISPNSAETGPAVDPLILTSWMAGDGTPLNPLDLTLKAWGLFAGDLPGPGRHAAIEAYLQRLAGNLPDNRTAAQSLAAHLVSSQQAVCSRRQAETWVAEALFLQARPTEADPVQVSENGKESPPETQQVVSSSDETGVENPDVESPSKDTPGPASVLPLSVLAPQKLIAGLLEAGLLVSRNTGRVGFGHPVIAGFLAGHFLDPEETPDVLLDQADWSIRNLALQTLACRSQAAPWVARLISNQNGSSLLEASLLLVARWLPYCRENTVWAKAALRQLAGIYHDESRPLALRSRSLAALYVSQAPGIAGMMQQSLSSKSAYQRQLAALGCGAAGEQQSVSQLSELLYDPSPNVQRSASLALMALRLKSAIDAVASALLHGDDQLKRIAAEALAVDPDQGHPLLREASRMEDLLVRRAAIAGISRVRLPWAEQVLRDLSIQDSQWVVKNAAAQAMEERGIPKTRLLKPLPELHESPWLISFAAGRGLGVLPGKHAQELLHTCLREGSVEHQLAALEYIGRSGNTNAASQILSLYHRSAGEVREKAFETLRRLAAAGAELSQPVERNDSPAL